MGTECSKPVQATRWMLETQLNVQNVREMETLGKKHG